MQRDRRFCLELCCKTGRITLPLRKSGIDIMGLDFTIIYAQKGSRKISRAGLGLGIAFEGIMRNFELDQKFDLILFPSILYSTPILLMTSMLFFFKCQNTSNQMVALPSIF